MDMISVSGSVKSLEKRFLDAPAIEKLIRTKNFADFAGMLGNSHYRLNPNAKKPEEAAEGFDDERKTLIEEMHKKLPRPLYSYFILKYDYHNLSLLAWKPQEAENYTALSSIDFRILKEAFETGNYKLVPSRLKTALSLIAGQKNSGASEISLLLQKTYHDVSRNLIETQKSPLLDYYAGINADFANISVFIRKKMEDEKTGAKNLVGGGNIKKERFANEDMLWKTVNTEYRKTITPIDAATFDRERYRTLMGYINRGRAMPYGIEPVFFYFAARELELEFVMRLALGKLYGIEPKTLSDWGAFPYQYA